MKTPRAILLALVVTGAGSLPVRADRALVTGFVKAEVYQNITGTSVADLTASQNFMDNKPDSTLWLRLFESPVSGDNYGQRIAGLLVPPITGAYVFFIASDDNSELWLSTDDQPANKQWIAGVAGWTNSREWNKYPDTQNNAIAPVTLEAGKPYYIEALMKEGGGGDNLAVGWVLPNQYVDPYNPPDGLTNVTVIPGSVLGAYVEQTNSRVVITLQPTNVTAFTSMRALFSVAATGNSDLGTFVMYQWKRNGMDIAGATTAYYLTPELVLSDSGARYACVVSVPGAAQTSQEVTLTVLDAQAPQLHIELLAPARTNAAVWWATPDPGFSLQGVATLTQPSWISVSEPVTFAGLTARVTVPAVNSRFFRLGHGKVLFESLWADSMTPAGGTATQVDYELGTMFQATGPGIIRGIRLYVLPGEAGIHVARIWRNRDNKLVGGPYEIAVGGFEGWFVYYLPAAITIEPETTYTVSVSTGQDPGKLYASSPNVLSSPGGNGQSLRYPASAGVFTTKMGTRPSQSMNASVYFRDVVFLLTEIATENLITWELDRPVSYSRGGEGVAYDLGMVFRASMGGMINAIRVFAISAEGGTHTATLWKNSTETLVGGPYEFTCGASGGVGASAWFTYPLPDPVAIEANTDYTVSVTTGTDASLAYPFISGVFNYSGDNGQHLSYSAGAGVSGIAGGRPTETTLGVNTNGSYLRDIVFQPTGSAETETIMSGGAVYWGKLAGSRELGTVFQASTPGVIKGIRVYSVSAESGVHLGRLWRNSDNSLIGGPYALTYGGTNGWMTFGLTNAVSIQSNVLYTISVTTGDDAGKVFPIVPDGFAGAGGNAKHLSYPAAAGLVGSTLGSRPTQTTNASFLRDIVFQPGVTKPRATMGNTTDGNFADYITDANTAWINAMRFRASANMTVTTIKAKIDSVPGHYKCAVYSDLNGMGDHLLMRTQEKANPAAAWNEFPLENPLKLKAGTYYWLAIWSDDQNARVYYTSQSGGTLKWAPYAYGDWPDPIVLERNGSTYLYCLYAEGTFDD